MFQTHLPLSQKSHFRKFIHKYAYTYLKYLEGHLLEDFLQKPKIVSTQVLIYGDVVKYGIAVQYNTTKLQKRMQRVPSSYNWHVTHYPKLSDAKQWFYYVHGYSRSRIQKGHSRSSLFLFHPLWGLNWEDLKPWRWLHCWRLKYRKGLLTHRYGTECGSLEPQLRLKLQHLHMASPCDCFGFLTAS